MQFLPEHTYHVYNQGNNREQLFFERENYLYFLKKVEKHLVPHVNILAWCLMPNHYHILFQVKPEYNSPDNIQESNKVGTLNRSIGIIQSSYTQAINKKLNRSGSLFRARAKAKSLAQESKTHNDYGVNCFLYIHQNPIRAKLVTELEEWEFSSYQDYAGFRKGKLCDQELARDLFKLPIDNKKFRAFSKQTISDEFLYNVDFGLTDYLSDRKN
jgi:putative transposase